MRARLKGEAPVEARAVVTPEHRSRSRNRPEPLSVTRRVLLSIARMLFGELKSAPPLRKPPSFTPDPVPVSLPRPPPTTVEKKPVTVSKTRIL